MNTHRSLMLWPLTERGLTMTPGELIAEALDAICEWAWKRDIRKGTS